MQKSIYLFILVLFLSLPLMAQQAIIELENDETLPIAPARFDDAVELPKDNFSSVGKQDMWEKFERGELDEKAFIKLQQDYQMAASQSKDPVVKRKIASDAREKKAEAIKLKKEEAAAKLAESKKQKKKEEATRFDREIDMMAKEKEVAQKKAAEDVKKAQAKQDAINAKSKKRMPASSKKPKLPKKKKK